MKVWELMLLGWRWRDLELSEFFCPFFPIFTGKWGQGGFKGEILGGRGIGRGLGEDWEHWDAEVSYWRDWDTGSNGWWGYWEDWDLGTGIRALFPPPSPPDEVESSTKTKLAQLS